MDIVEVNNSFFGSMQIKNLTQESFNLTLDHFNINNSINIFTYGGFDEKLGSYYIVYNTDIFNFKEIKEIITNLLVNQNERSEWACQDATK